MTYKAQATFAIATVDSYENGQETGGQHKEYNLTHEGDTIQEVLQSIAEGHSLNIEDLLLDSCEEKGRIDVSFMENNESEQPSKQELGAWKKGELVLWCIDLSYTLIECKTVTAITAVTNTSPPTLLEIYESFHNGQLKQFVEQVKEYEAKAFALDTEPEIEEGILTTNEAYKMLRTFTIMNK